MKWYKKRILRLLIPFYLYFLTHLFFVFLSPQIFSNFGLRLDGPYITSSLIMMGGIGVSWIPMLFVQLALLFPFLMIAKRRNKLRIYECILVIILLFQTLYPIPTLSHKLLLWLPWSLVFCLGIELLYMNEQMRKKTYIFLGCLFILLFILLYFIFENNGRSLILTHHKYPPDYFYFAYATGVPLLLMWGISSLRVWESMKKWILFISKNSYSLFFVHFIILDLSKSILKNSLFDNPFFMSFFVISLSLFVIFLLSKLKPFLNVFLIQKIKSQFPTKKPSQGLSI